MVSPVRSGGQAQVITTPLPSDDDVLISARLWAIEHLDQPITLEQLGGRASMSVRTLTRRFQAETGLSPLRWLLHQRISRAQELLESTSFSVDEVARLSGLGSADSLRAHLIRKVGLTPTAYRTTVTRR